MGNNLCRDKVAERASDADTAFATRQKTAWRLHRQKRIGVESDTNVALLVENMWSSASLITRHIGCYLSDDPICQSGRRVRVPGEQDEDLLDRVGRDMLEELLRRTTAHNLPDQRLE